MRYSPVVVAVVVALLMLAGPHCAPNETHENYSAVEGGPVLEDLALFSDGKEDSAFFNPNRLIEQSTFEDADFMSLEEIQTFLEETPYGHPSFLASYTWNGEPVAQIIYRVAQTFHINPLILLTKLQVESSLIFRTIADPFLVEVAMGCGCLDEGPTCGGAPLGFGRQIECAGSLFRAYLDSIEHMGVTISGWGTNVAKNTSEGITVTPQNAATAALYTYTPWILEGSGGNWLFWNVYRKFSYNLFRSRPNYEWVGSICESKNSCPFESGACMIAQDLCMDGSQCDESFPMNWFAAPEGPEDEGWGTPVASEGICTASCDLYCEDSSNPFTSVTFCAVLNDSAEETDTDDGWCVAQCDLELFPDNAGCASGTTCAPARRANDASTVKDVCWPDAFGKVEVTEPLNGWEQ